MSLLIVTDNIVLASGYMAENIVLANSYMDDNIALASGYMADNIAQSEHNSTIYMCVYRTIVWHFIKPHKASLF